MRFLSLFILTFLIMGPLVSQSKQGVMHIKVLNEDGVGLEGATLKLYTEEEFVKGDVTDAEGRLNLYLDFDIDYRLYVEHLGYTTQDVPLNLSEERDEYILFFRLEPSEIAISAVDVTVGRYNTQEFLPNLVQTITIDEVRKLPATFFDPARAAQNFAGVANSNDQANGISVRGNQPDFFKWYLEGVEIVNPNHTSNAGTFSDRPTQNAGGVNILSAQMLSKSQFYKSIYPVAYQNAQSGILGMSLRNGDNSKRKHFAQVGLIGLELSSEGPIQKDKPGASYLFNYRFSTVGLLTQLGLDFGGEAIDFQDLAFNFSFPTQKGIFKVFAIGGLSNNVFTAPLDETEREEEKDNTNIDFSGDMGLVGVNYDTYLSPKNRLNFTSILSANINSRMSTAVDFPDQSISDSNQQTMLSSKVSFDHKLDKGNIQFGIFNNILTYDFASANSILSESITVEDEQINRIGIFGQLDYALGKKWRWSGGVNLTQQMSSIVDSEFLVEPRSSFSYQINKNNSLQLVSGLYSQSNAPRIYHISDQLLNNNVRNIKSWQNVLNYTYRVKNIEWRTEAFYQFLYDVPIADAEIGFDFSVLNGLDGVDVLPLESEGEGRNIGIETGIRKTPDYYGWLWGGNATVYKSQYRTNTDEWLNTRFDGTYIFNVLVGKEWTKKRKRTFGIHARANYLGGFRATPIDLLASRDAGRTIFDESAAFTLKQEDYFRVDFSIYRKVERKKYTSTLSLDIQNVLNQKNEAFRFYDSFLDRVVLREQLGLLPIINYRIQF